MITNFKTNKVYFAKGISICPYLDGITNLVNFLHRCHIAWQELPSTQSLYHIWARDYMPIQVRKDKFVQFCYTPDYLKNDPKYQPDTKRILDDIGIDVISSDIVLDGGNVISCGDKVILTNKIFSENPNYSQLSLINALSELLEAEIVIIPWDRYEEYGHSDGMVRYIGEGKVLLNNYIDFDKSLRNKILKILKPHFDVNELHYGASTSNSWAYLNFLHIGHYIFIPHLNENNDEQAYAQIQAAFPDSECYSIGGWNFAVRDGGALNCTTWNVLESLEEEPKLLQNPVI